MSKPPVRVENRQEHVLSADRLPARQRLYLAERLLDPQTHRLNTRHLSLVAWQRVLPPREWVDEVLQELLVLV
jgi:hypothetical protein